MSVKHPNNLTDAELSALYQSLKTEQPSALVDAAILAQAKQQSVQLKNVGQPDQTEEQASRPEHYQFSQRSPGKKSNWRRWQWPVSIAASVCLLCVVFINQLEFFVEQAETTAVPLPPVAPSSSSKPQAVSDAAKNNVNGYSDNIEIIEMAQYQRSQAEQQEQAMQARHEAENKRIAEAGKTDRMLAARKAAQAGSPIEKPKQEAEATQHHQQLVARLEELQHQLSSKQAQWSALNQQQIVVTGARLSREKPLDSFQSKPEKEVSSESAEQASDMAPYAIGHLEKQALQQEISELQQRLLSAMKALRAESEQWQADDSILKLLTEPQQTQWQELLQNPADTGSAQ